MITCVIIFSTFYSLAKGEYYIRDGDVPSYLYRKFEGLEEEIFPRDIRIKMSLTRISGTLFYSIDRHKNQLIVNLKDNKETAMFLEFNKQPFDVSISQLCSCESCLYVVIDLRIQISDRIYIECNGGRAQIRSFNKTKDVNKDFIIPFTEAEFNAPTINEAHMWIVNNERNGNVYPNPDQLSGCIFDILYTTQDIAFTYISKNVVRTCNRTCKNDICNGGQCLETFGVTPICNCTTVFKNGPYCNNMMHSMNIIASNLNLQFYSFKLSWKSLSNEIFMLGNKNVRIVLNRVNAELSLEYHFQTFSLIMKSILSQTYVPNIKYTLVVAFSEYNIDVKISNKMAWNSKTIIINRDLRKETFTSLLFRSGDGVIEMVYKLSPKEYSWRPVKIKKFKKFENENLTISSTTSPIVKTYNGITSISKASSKSSIIVSIIVPILVMFIIGGSIVLLVCCYKRRNRNRNEGTDQPNSFENNSNTNVNNEEFQLNEFQTEHNDVTTPLVGHSPPVQLNELQDEHNDVTTPLVGHSLPVQYEDPLIIGEGEMKLTGPSVPYPSMCPSSIFPSLSVQRQDPSEIEDRERNIKGPQTPSVTFSSLNPILYYSLQDPQEESLVSKNDETHSIKGNSDSDNEPCSDEISNDYRNVDSNPEMPQFPTMPSNGSGDYPSILLPAPYDGPPTADVDEQQTSTNEFPSGQTRNEDTYGSIYHSLDDEAVEDWLPLPQD